MIPWFSYEKQIWIFNIHVTFLPDATTIALQICNFQAVRLGKYHRLSNGFFRSKDLRVSSWSLPGHTQGTMASFHFSITTCSKMVKNQRPKNQPFSSHYFTPPPHVEDLYLRNHWDRLGHVTLRGTMRSKLHRLRCWHRAEEPHLLRGCCFTGPRRQLPFFGMTNIWKTCCRHSQVVKYLGLCKKWWHGSAQLFWRICRFPNGWSVSKRKSCIDSRYCSDSRMTFFTYAGIATVSHAHVRSLMFPFGKTKRKYYRLRRQAVHDMKPSIFRRDLMVKASQSRVRKEGCWGPRSFILGKGETPSGLASHLQMICEVETSRIWKYHELFQKPMTLNSYVAGCSQTQVATGGGVSKPRSVRHLFLCGPLFKHWK